MECRYLQICLVLAVAIIGGSYAYGWGRPHGYGWQPEPRYYGPPRPYGGYGPPRHHGGHHGQDSSSDEEFSSSDEEERRQREAEKHHEEEDDHIWRFQISDDFDAYAYVDNNGHTAGFLIDLLHAVCERAHKRCYYMVDTSTHCWRTDGEKELPGIGLMDHYYDGCIGYWQSSARRNSFNFSLPFSPDVKASLHYKAGDKIDAPSAVTGKKIGFVAGWPISKKCFEKQAGFTGNSPGKYTPVLFETHGGMVDALKAGTINAVLTVDSYRDEPLGIQHTDPSFHCTEAGASLMTMYGSEMIDWWNRAFMDMKHDGSFRRLCQSSSRVHAGHGQINCIH